jgi:putative DNA primase/helicase
MIDQLKEPVARYDLSDFEFLNKPTADEIDFCEGGPPAPPPMPRDTGARTPAASAQPAASSPEMDDGTVQRLMFTAKNREKNEALWNGTATGYASDSERDLAMAMNIAFYTRDPVQIERLMRSAPLTKDRGKWQREKYVTLTISKALQMQAERYSGSGGDPDAGMWPSDADEELRITFTDSFNADYFCQCHGNDIIYVTERKSWFWWTGKRWEHDKTDRVRRLALRFVQTELRQKLLDAADEADDKNKSAYHSHLKASQNRTRIDAFLSLASTKRAVSVTQLDQPAWAFNVANGTIDLRSGELQPHDRRDLLTKLSDVVYDPAATCPTWDAVIQRVMRRPDGTIREEVEQYFQACVGYNMTPEVTEQCLFILHGGGENGKTTVLETIKGVMGDYGIVAAQSLLMREFGQRSNGEDEATLFGVRMALCSETTEGQHFDEAKLKRLTGARTIRARLLYENSFEFPATFKIWLDCNHLPSITGSDHGIWRRLKRIPFEARILSHEKDRDILKKLDTERSGILNWMLAGLKLWREKGLVEPQEIADAIKEYRSDSDIIGRFIDDTLVYNDAGRVTKDALYVVYKRWCEDNGHRPHSKLSLGKKLKDKNIAEIKSGSVRYWIGIEFNEEVQDEPADAWSGWGQ